MSINKPFGPLEDISAKVPWAVFPRKRLDVSYGDFMSGLISCLSIRDDERSSIQSKVETFWAPDGSAMLCLSIRTGFDLMLRVLNFPPGTEIICSAITIPDMIYLIRHHGLIPVPVDLNSTTCFPREESLDKIVGKKTRAILVAHVFGTRNSMDEVVAFAKSKNLLVIEDCAQVYSGQEYRGHPDADVSMFSFGTIKTATAFGGALLKVKDRQLLSRMKEECEKYPIRPRSEFLLRLLRYLVIHGLATPALYGVLVRACKLCNISHDEIITSLIRGFAGGDLITLIRQRPSTPLIALLWRRLSTFDGSYLAARRAKSLELASLVRGIPDVEIPGSMAQDHFYWLFPIVVPCPKEVASQMTNDGFDVTSGATQLAYVDATPEECASSDVKIETPLSSQHIMANLVYLPVTPEMPSWALKKMVNSLERALANYRNSRL